MPLFKSLRSKSSRKSTASEISIADANNSSTDFGPRSPSSTTHGSVRSTKMGAAANLQSNSVSSMDKVNAGRSSVPSSPSRYRASSYFREEGVNNGAGPTLMQTVSELGNGNSSALAPLPTEPEIPKPRPSELFAGKGVQWQSVKLAGPPPSPSSLPKSNTNEDLQAFLKMRRQWKPTFAEHESPERRSQVPRDLSQLTFSSQDDIRPQGIMSFKDLDESHQRKQKLMNSPPRGSGGLFDESESSKAALNRPIVERGSSLPKNTKPEAVRKVSNKSNKSARKFFGGSKASETTTEAVPVPSLSTVGDKGVKGEEVWNVASQQEAASKAIPKETPTISPDRAPPPIQSKLPDMVTQSKSIQSLEEGIADEGDKTLLADEDGKLISDRDPLVQQSAVPSTNAATPAIANGSEISQIPLSGGAVPVDIKATP